MGEDNWTVTTDNTFLERKELLSTVDCQRDYGPYKFVNFTTRGFRAKEWELVKCQFRSAKHGQHSKREITVTQYSCRILRKTD